MEPSVSSAHGCRKVSSVETRRGDGPRRRRHFPRATAHARRRGKDAKFARVTSTRGSTVKTAIPAAGSVQQLFETTTVHEFSLNPRLARIACIVITRIGVTNGSARYPTARYERISSVTTRRNYVVYRKLCVRHDA